MRRLSLGHCFGVLALCLFLSNCKNEIRDGSDDHRYIPTEFKHYFAFKPGSWWIYKDSITGAFDTLEVTGFHSDTAVLDVDANASRASCERIYIELYARPQAVYYFQSAVAHVISPPATVKLKTSRYHPSTGSRERYEMFYPFDPSQAVHNVPYNQYETDYVTAHPLGQYQNFSGVMLFQSTKSIFEMDKPTRSFYAPHIGLIRYEVPDSNKFRILVDHYVID